MSDPHVPASAPGDDEPKTPMWLPALGAALFIALGLWWAVTPSAPPAAQAATAASASASAAAPSTAPAPPTNIAGAAQAPARPMPPGAPPGAGDLQRQLEQLRQHIGAQHPGGH